MNQKIKHKRIFNLIIINLLLISYISTDNECDGCTIIENNCQANGESSTCPETCRPKLFGIGRGCYNCQEGEGMFFKIYSEGCTFLSSCEGKRVFGTNECVESCEGGYEFFNYCYSECPINTNDTENTHSCRCGNKIYIEEEIHKCTENEECPNGYDYFYGNQCFSDSSPCNHRKKKKVYRNNNTVMYRCSNDCESNEEYINNYCVDICDLNEKYYYPNEGNKKCVTDCSLISKYENNNGECITCDQTGEFIDGSRCVSLCSSGFVENTGNTCKNSESASNCVYLADGEPNKKCYDSCLDIPVAGENKYQRGNMCSNIQCPHLFSNEDGIIKCFDSISDCKDNGYNYIRNDEECLKDCTSYRAGEDSDSTLIRCFDSKEDCQHNGLIFYTSDKKCYNDISSFENYYPHEFDSQNKPKEDSSGNTFSTCNLNLPKISKNFCKEHCDEDECYYLSSQLCKSISEEFYYINNEFKKICVNNCKENNKFFFPNTKICIEKCTLDNVNYFYYDSSNNQCLQECDNYHEIPESDHKECKTSLPAGKYYNENKEILDSCNKFYSSEDNNKCIDSCGINEKVDGERICIPTCPSIRPKFGIININIGDPAEEVEIKKCANECSDLGAGYIYYIPKEKQCVKSCDQNFYYIFNNNCYRKCEGGNNLFDSSFECQARCPSKKRKITDINLSIFYFCVESCNSNEYFYEDECLDKCPIDHNKIGKDNKCKNECEEQDGIFYKKFQTIDIGNYIYKCISNCPNENEIYKTDDKECVSQCPSGFNYVIKDTFDCLSECPDEFPFYKLTDTPNFICSNTFPCSSVQYFYQGNCLSADECKAIGQNYVDSRNICKNSCESTNYIETISDGFHICKSECNKYIRIIESSNNICVEKCPYYENFINSGDICKSSCLDANINLYYEFERIATGESYSIYKCVASCPTTHNLRVGQVNTDNQCYNGCPDTYPYLLEEKNLCYFSCLGTNYPLSLSIESTGKKICSDTCNMATPVTDYNGKCVHACDINNEYKFNLDNKCVRSCEGEKLRYSATDYVCKEICTSPNNFVLGNECKASCTDFKKKVIINNIETGEYECVPQCQGLFYYSTDKICLEHCNTNDYAIYNTLECIRGCDEISIDGEQYYYYEGSNEEGAAYSFNTCVKQCPGDKQYLKDNVCVNLCDGLKPYLDQNQCVSECPSERKYFVSNFVFNEIDTKKKCLSNCPPGYSYYKEIIEGSIHKFECIHECQEKYFQDINSGITIKKCVSDSECPNNQYKYIVGNECLVSCPNGKYYVPLIGETCQDSCPQDSFPFNDLGFYECKKVSDCQYKKADLDSKLCVDSCPTYSKYTYEYEDAENNVITVCLSSCGGNYGKYITPENKCVSTCDPDLNLENDDSSTPYKCKCKYKYYIDLTTNKLVCLEEGENCDQSRTSYNILKFGTNECIDRCDSILSLNGENCYNNQNQCETNTQVITMDNGQKKCECKYKFYKEVSSNIKHCMNSNESCGKYYVPSTKECVQECPSGFTSLFKNNCLHECPRDSEIVNGECTCKSDKKYWYAISDRNFICLPGNCIEDYPLLIYEVNQCVQKCKDSEYYLLVNNECKNRCEDPNTIEFDIPSFWDEYKYARKTCLCKHHWYFDEVQNKNICPEPDKECSEYNSDFKYMVRSTKQCVKFCPPKYPYSFNGECFNDCENEIRQAPEYQYNNMKTDRNTNRCICGNLWKYIDDDKNIECLNVNYCEDGFLEIYDTKECLESTTCPISSSLFLNKVCYSSCPINSHYDDTKRGKCICDNLWYIDANIKNPCLLKSIENCPDPHYYQIFNTKECILPQLTDSKCPDDNPYSFNYKCYENKCPENTKPKNDMSKICICDETKGKWYKIHSNDGKEYLYCGLKDCPEIKPNFLEDSKRCTYNCDEDNEDEEKKWAYRGICYKDCPDYTYKINIGYKYCSFYRLDESSNLEQLRNYVSVQVKELYESGPIGGVLYNNFDTSLQIYSLKNNSIDKELTLKSNLSYIDLDTCLNKVLQDQNFTENDTIYVVKYDLLNTKRTDSEEDEDEETSNNKNSDYYLANQVEYEFYSSKTLKRIEISVCDPNEIIISYPISYTLKKFDDLLNGINKNEYRNKFEIGKKLHRENNNIDTFNFNNSVYKELCTSVVINGKDLVLEDRYTYLFPNNVSLCEDNCSVFYTDYDLERVNCKCNYKEIFDFNREEPVSSDLLNDPNFVNPTQSGANAEIIKCLSKLPSKDSILKNEAFYYTTVITVAEVSMIFVAAFHGIKAVSANITSLMNRANIKIDTGNKNQSVKNKFKNDNNITTSHRILNNPPKKGENNLTNDEEEKKSEAFGNIINRKNIEINNYNNNNIYNDINNESISKNESENNYGLDIKNGGIYTNIRNNNNNLIDNQNQYVNIDFLGKTEFMPEKYNFKYFKSNDKGIIKKIERNKLQFKVKPSTKYILERKENINYDPDYLNGPFLPTQNIIEIIDEEKVVKYENDQNLELNKKMDKNAPNKNGNQNNINNKNSMDTKNTKIRTIKNNKDINNEKDFITIKKIGPNRRKNDTNFIVQDYKEPKEERDIYDNTGLYTLIKREQALLRVPYKIYLEKKHPNLLAIFLAEIMDKIYLIKICCFLKKFEIFSVHLTLYLICHLMLLTLLCAFFSIKTIKKIWTQSNFPQLNFYLLYGFLGNIVIFVIYKIFLCLLDSQDKVKELISIKNKSNNDNNKKNNNMDEMSEKVDEVNEEVMQEKFKNVIKIIKIRMIIFFIIGLLITAFCFIYLVSFFAIYTGTKSKVFKMYYIALVEILLIKIIYAIILASLRIASEGNKIEIIYKVVYICNKYVS